MSPQRTTTTSPLSRVRADLAVGVGLLATFGVVQLVLITLH